MIKSGLVSISFRKLTVAEVVNLVSEAGLSHIEWGGDVHVPHGDLAIATQVRKLMESHKLHTAAYGSYYRAGAADQPDFNAVAETASILGAPTIRVWAGNLGSAECSAEQRAAIIRDLRRITAIAAGHGISISTEFHGGTITDTNESTTAMLNEIQSDNFRTYWQPAVNRSVEYRLAGLQEVLPRLTNVHVFQWKYENGVNVRLPLAEGAADWKIYLDTVKSTGREHIAMLEFVRDDSVEQFKEDAATLNAWLS